MEKIDASKLIQFLLAPEKSSSIYVILSDNAIFKKVIEDRLEQEQGFRAKSFLGKNSIEDYVNYLATCGMFEPAKKCVVEFPDKVTQKNWNESKQILSRLPLPLETSVYLFGPLSLKNTLKLLDFPKGTQIFYAFEPNDQDLPRCAHALLLRYSGLAKKDKNTQLETVRLALESYSNELLSCDLHFARMEKGNLNFSAALAGNPEVNGFHVADSIAINDKHLIELRLSQCADCGEEASSVFMAIAYFLKQVLNTQAALEETGNLKLAFEKAKIPYPAQARIQKALSHLKPEKLYAFFANAAKVEIELRLQKNPHKFLSAELISWLGC